MTVRYHYTQEQRLNIINRKSLWPSLSSVLAFVIPAAMFFEIKAVGRLFGSDILCLGLFPFLLFVRGRFLKSSFVYVFLLLGGLYFFGQFFTDILLEIPFTDYARGWAKISVTIIIFCSLFMVIGSDRRKILICAFGIVSGQILQFYFNPGIFTADYPWKFGIGSPVTWLLMIFAAVFSTQKKKLIDTWYVLPFFAGALNLYFGLRSLAGICFLTVAYLMLQAFLKGRKGKEGKKLSKQKIILLAIGFLGAAILIVNFYELSARQGWLGVDQQRKYETQAQGELGLLIGGRSEILVSARAILESPIIGHGSWAKDWEYAEMLVELKRRLGYSTGPAQELGLIPTHSHLFGAWVEAGIFGAVFWGWMLLLPIRASLRLFTTQDPHTPLFIFIAFILTWGILFSPFGSTLRFMIPFYAVCMIDVLSRYPIKKRNA